MNRYEEILTKKGFPLPPGGEVLDARYSMGDGDWYGKTAKGWFWWSGRDWKLCPYGPNPR